jgi:hypothetical protein
MWDAGSQSSTYKFSGLLKCSECGANVSIVSGRWRGRNDVVYGCPQNTFRGASVCTNSVRVFRRALEERLLHGLQEQIMNPEAVNYVLEKFEAELVKALDNLGGELDQMRRRKEALEREVANLAAVIAQGDFSAALRAALVDRERQISEITARLLESRPDSLRIRLRSIRSFVVSRMQDLRAILNSDFAHVRAELAKHIEKITLTPSGETYIASGTWNFVGVAVSMVPGARIELATPAFSGRRSTSELPRHGGNLLILGVHGSGVKYDREEREEG